MHRFSYKTLFLIIVFLLIPIVLMFRLSQKPTSTSAAWWNEVWTYRRPLSLTNSSTAQSNVYISLTLDTSDTTRFQADAGDLRFTDASGSLLDYYIVSGAGTSSTSIHLNFSSLPAGTSLVYLYYGNPQAPNGFSSSDFSTPASSTTPDTPATEEVSSAPIAYWSFDEGVGTTAYDISGRASDTSFVGSTAPVWVNENDCVVGKCLKFNGSTSYLQTINPYNFDLNDNPAFTISMWFKGNSFSTPDAPELFKANITNGWINLRVAYNNELEFQVKGNAATTMEINSPNSSIQENTWYHLNAIYNSNGTSMIYLNGQQVGTTSTTNVSPIAKNGPIYIGQGFNIWKWNGYIDEVKVFPYARSSDQIKAEYAAGQAGISSHNTSSTNIGSDSTSTKSLSDGLVAYWQMNEDTGTTTLDSSGNNNTATFGTGTSAPAWDTGKFGSAINFDGSDDFVQASDSSSLDAASAWTISAWINPDEISIGSGKQMIISKWQNSTGQVANYSLELNTSGVPKVSTSNSSGSASIFTLAGSTATTINTWQLVTATFDGATQKLRLYLNSNSIGETTTGFSQSYVNTGNVRIGQYDFDWSTYRDEFNGRIDNVRIYNRALTLSEVEGLYNFAPPPVASYDFEDGNSPWIKNNSGTGFTGLWYGTGTHYTTGKIGQAGRFNGVDDYVNLGSTGMNVTRSSTLEAWVYPESNTAGTSGIIGNSQGTRLTWSGTNFQIFLTNNAWTPGYRYATSATQALNNWYHVVGVRDLEAGTIKIYINGVLSTGTTAVPTDPVPNLAWTIGKRDSATTFVGKIDQVKVYDYARTPAQIVQDMNAGGPVSKSTLLYYKFDEGNGTTTHDSSISNNTGTFGTGNSAPTWVDGKFGKALHFDGVNNNQYVDFTDIPTTLNNFSLSAWVYNETGGDSSHSILRNFWEVRSNQICFWSYSFVDQYWRCSASGTVPSDQWVHLVTTFDGSIIRHYINGKISWTDTAPTTGTNQAFVTIGGYPDRRFNGMLDELKIYSYTLSPDEVKQDYNQGSAIVFGANNKSVGDTSTSYEYCIPGDTSTCSSPVAEWNFEEGVGTSAYDSSGNNYNGTWSGTGTHYAPGKYGSAAKTNITTSDYLNMGTSIGVTGPLTIEYWFKPDYTLNTSSPGSHQFIASRNGWFQNSFRHDSGSISFSLGNSSSVYFTPTSWSPTWTHITITYDNSSIKGYINGVLNTTSNQSGIGFTTTDTLYLGQYFTNSIRFDGAIDQFRIFNYARSPAQVVWDYSKGAPVAHFKFDECQGNIVHSSTGIGITGSINIGASGTQTQIGTCQSSGTAWGNGASGKINSSLSFDSSDDLLSFTPTNLSSSHVSVALWTKIDSYINYNSLTAHNWVDQGWSLHASNTGSIYFGIGQSTNQNLVYTSSNQPTGVWQHLVGTYDGSTVKLYQNGKLIQSKALSNATLNTSSNVSIGNHSSSQIDDYRLYNYALTAEQVQQIYNNGSISFN